MKFGVDLSEYQKNINMSKVKDEGVEFVMLRASWTGYGKNRSKNTDDAFENLYNKCKSLGIPVGAYHYSCADSYEEGRKEAEYMYENCLKGKVFEYPIALDVENDTWQGNCSRDRLTDAFFGFFDYLNEKHFYVTLYATSSWFESKFNLKRLENIDKWVADWGNNPPELHNMGLWQFGGETNLIRSNKIASMTIDQNYSFRDYPSIMKKDGFNGFGKTTVIPTAKPKKFSNLKKGSEGSAVKQLQKNLNYVMGRSLDEDGIFGSKTEEALIVFQSKNGLDADGIYGSKSDTKMKECASNEYTVKVAVDVLNVRKGAGTDYPVVTTVRRGDVFKVNATSGDWGRLANDKGYICLDYVVKV